MFCDKSFSFYISSHPMQVFHLPLKYFFSCTVESHIFDFKNDIGCNMTPISGAVNAGKLLPVLEKMNFVEFDLR